jgi:hypothetical protein
MIGRNLGPQVLKYSKVRGVTSEKDTIRRTVGGAAHSILGFGAVQKFASLLAFPLGIRGEDEAEGWDN